MNERIKLLAERARKKPLGNSWTYRLSGEFEQKFAELIVKECAEIATINQFQWDSAGGYVLKHFGVEE
jgi:hypothetical protein